MGVGGRMKEIVSVGGGVVDVAVLLNFNEHQGEFILHIFFSSHSVFSLPLAAPIF